MFHLHPKYQYYLGMKIYNYCYLYQISTLFFNIFLLNGPYFDTELIIGPGGLKSPITAGI